MERALWNKDTKSGHSRWSREGAPGAGRRVVWRTLHVTAQEPRRVRVAPWVTRQRDRGVRPMSVSLASCSMRLSFSEQVLRQYLEARTERDRTRRLSVAPRFARGGGGGRRRSELGCGSASGLGRGSMEECGRGCVRGGGRREEKVPSGVSDGAGEAEEARCSKFSKISSPNPSRGTPAPSYQAHYGSAGQHPAPRSHRAAPSTIPSLCQRRRVSRGGGVGTRRRPR